MKPDEAIQRLVSVVRRKHFSLATERAYSGWLRRYIGFLSSRQWDVESTEQKIEAFLTSMAQSGCAASTQNQAFNAILFFYRDVLGQNLGKIDSLRATLPEQVRIAPEVSEIVALLEKVQDVGGYPTRLIVRLLYGCGMRVTEPLNLRLKDVEIGQSRIVIRSAKGGKDRIVALPCSIVSDLAAQLEFAAGVAERDRVSCIPVSLPGLLAEKYPAYQFAKGWAWLFPANSTCRDPRTNRVVRWRCHEVNVQRAVRTAARAIGLTLTPHHLRHAYATHSLNRGVNIRALQAAMGHKHVDTTARYCHADALSVSSPLDYCSSSA